MSDDIRHGRMIIRKPVDHVLAVAYVHQRIACTASFEPPGPHLLAGIFALSQVPVRRVLRPSFFAGGRSLIETVCPQRFLLEVDWSQVGARFVVRRCLRSFHRLWRPQPAGVVIPRDADSQRETDNRKDNRTHVTLHSALLWCGSGSMPNCERFTKVVLFGCGVYKLLPAAIPLLSKEGWTRHRANGTKPL